jgi:DnaK suppressor protein
MDGNVKKKGQTETTDKIPPISVGELMRREGNTAVEHRGFRSSFVERLKNRKQELEDALKGLDGSDDAYRGMLSSDDFIDLLDHAEREISTQITYSLLERKKSELGKILHLLNRIVKNEEFGICEDCGRRIPEARLLIVPETARCVRCQSKTEKRNSRKSLLEKSRTANRHKKRLELEDKGESDVQKKPSTLDGEPLSFMDMEEEVIETDKKNDT